MAKELYKKLTKWVYDFFASWLAGVKRPQSVRIKIYLILLPTIILLYLVDTYGTANEKEKATLICVVIWLAVLIYDNRKTEKANFIISTQKKALEEKTKEVLDSITYAKRLQDAILPSIAYPAISLIPLYYINQKLL